MSRAKRYENMTKKYNTCRRTALRVGIKPLNLPYACSLSPIFEVFSAESLWVPLKLKNVEKNGPSASNI